MKKNMIQTLVLSLMVTSTGIVNTACSDYDDDINRLTQNIDKLEQTINNQETTINNQEVIINAIENGGYVVSITPIENGYVLTFNNGETVTIKNGEKGEPGERGEDGDSFFKSVTVGTDAVTLTLADGTTCEVPVFDSFKKVRDRVQSIVYVPDYFDGQIGVKNDQAQTLRYQVKPAAVGTYLVEHKDAMSLVGEEVVMTRATTASLAITDATTADGLLSLSVKPTGFAAQKGYAFALDIEADGSSYRTAYTPTFLIVEAEKIALGINGLYPGMGIVTTGTYLQLFVVFFPDNTTSRGITWTSSDEMRATVNNSGIVAVTKDAPDGEFTITATTTNGKKASLVFRIVDEKLQIDTEQLLQSMAQ